MNIIIKIVLRFVVSDSKKIYVPAITATQFVMFAAMVCKRLLELLKNKIFPSKLELFPFFDSTVYARL